LNARILAPIAFDWTESKDGSGNLRWRVAAPNDHRAEIYQAVGDGAWCAIVDMRGTRDLGSKEGAMRFAEARLTDVIEGEFLAARRTLSALLPLTRVEDISGPVDDGDEDDVDRMAELAALRDALDAMRVDSPISPRDGTGTTDDARRAEAAEADIRRLSALLEGRFSDVRLVEFAGGELSLQGTLFEYVAEFMAQMLTAGGARPNPANYTETLLEHPELGPLVLTLQRQSGETPHELRREAEAERDALIEALHDAIVRPMGVVPASAETWYDHRRADAAVKNRSAAANLLPSGADALPAATHRHRKGGLYRMIARGRIEATLEPCVIYEGIEGGLVWVRSEEEFSDGRFTALVDEAALPRLAPLPPRAEDHV
jgi:hypothetical protein